MKRRGLAMMRMVGTPLDMGRLSTSVARPGIDPRSWLSFARIDDDPDAVVWDAELGWLVDVTLCGGELDGEGPVLCRCPGRGQYTPPVRDALAVVLLPNGDPETAVLVMMLDDADHPPPAEVNGTAIDEAFARRTHIAAHPAADLDAEFTNVRVTGQMVLGVRDADQPFVRGTAQADAIDTLLDAMSSFLSAAQALPIMGAVNVASFKTGADALKLAITAFKAKRSSILSTTIRGT